MHEKIESVKIDQDCVNFLYLLVQGQFSMLEVTEDAKALVTLVRDFTKNNSRVTLLQIVEVYKGSDLQKIRESGIVLNCIFHKIFQSANNVI